MLADMINSVTWYLYFSASTHRIRKSLKIDANEKLTTKFAWIFDVGFQRFSAYHCITISSQIYRIRYCDVMHNVYCIIEFTCTSHLRSQVNYKRVEKSVMRGRDQKLFRVKGIVFIYTLIKSCVLLYISFMIHYHARTRFNFNTAAPSSWPNPESKIHDLL